MLSIFLIFAQTLAGQITFGNTIFMGVGEIL